MRGASFGIPFWTGIEGNYGYGGAPPAGTHKELAFQLFGVPEPASGFCLLLGGALLMLRRKR